jgi:hypothetical protein
MLLIAAVFAAKISALVFAAIDRAIVNASHAYRRGQSDARPSESGQNQDRCGGF